MYLARYAASLDARSLRKKIGAAKVIIDNPADDLMHTFVPAIPILDDGGEAVAALWTAIPSGRMEPEHVRRCLRKLIRAARQFDA